jgi:hypothetical protein
MLLCLRILVFTFFLKTLIKQFLFATCLIGATSSEALSAPFHFNPQSFQNYLNSIRWDDGSKNRFQNLANCIYDNYLDNTSYRCTAGYVYSSSPMGNRVCTLTLVMWSPRLFALAGNLGGPSSPVQFATSECRYR